MDTTIPAAAAANVPATYTGGRADQSKTAGSDFKSALAETSPDRNQRQSNSDSSSTTTNASASDQSATSSVSAVSGKSSALNDNAPSSGDASKTATDDTATEVKQLLAEDASGAVASSKDANTSLAKLVAALTQGATADATPAATTTDEAQTDAAASGKTPVKENAKADEQQMLATLVGAEQTASDTTATVPGTKTGVKASALDKTKTSDKDEAPEATTKDTSIGVQDALSLLGQVAAAHVPAATSQDATATGSADDTVTAAIGDKLSSGLATKVKSDTATKTSDATASTTTTTASATATRSSAADALHMVSSSGHGTSAAAEEKLTVADSASLNTSGAMQGVDVLDSRRIIAPVNTSNGANIAATMTGDREWSSTMRSAASGDVSMSDKLTTDKTLNTLSIKMSPESLGTVTANLKLVDGQLTVSLVVENSSAYRTLHEDQGELMKSLKAQGFSIDQIQISIASPEKSSSDTSQNNSQSQTSHQQQAQQNSSGFNQGSGRQQAQPGFENFSQTSGGLVDEATPSGGLGSNNSNSGASGQLYL
ncbi:flagellar hook-length control protein FliK [Rhizobium sp.]|jgi:chemotaxis protein MotD|uniref:flagellar hook-length control protein FliK n=1 Tax=Rhizobium sp. TaxID=391 RepID=UPI000E8DAA6D|nr:hypothetical protein [Rhizobium sp.]